MFLVCLARTGVKSPLNAMLELLEMLNIQLLSIFSLWLEVYGGLAGDGPRKQGTEPHSNEFVVQIRQMQMDLR